MPSKKAATTPKSAATATATTPKSTTTTPNPKSASSKAEKKVIEEKIVTPAQKVVEKTATPAQKVVKNATPAQKVEAKTATPAQKVEAKTATPAQKVEDKAATPAQKVTKNQPGSKKRKAEEPKVEDHNGVNGNSEEKAESKPKKAKVTKSKLGNEHKILVRNLPTSATEEQVKALFPKELVISNVQFSFRVKRGDKLAFVEFKDKAHVEEGIKKIKGKEIGGRVVLADTMDDKLNVQGIKRNISHRVVFVTKKPKLTLANVEAKLASAGTVVETYETDQEKFLVKFFHGHSVAKAVALNGTSLEGVKLEIIPYPAIPSINRKDKEVSE